MKDHRTWSSQREGVKEQECQEFIREEGVRCRLTERKKGSIILLIQTPFEKKIVNENIKDVTCLLT